MSKLVKIPLAMSAAFVAVLVLAQLAEWVEGKWRARK